MLSGQSVLQATSRGGQQDGSELLASLQIQSGSTGPTNNGQSLQIPGFAKRQGVSGESSDLHNHHNHHHHHTSNRLANNQQSADISLLVTSHDKDFRYVDFNPKWNINWSIRARAYFKLSILFRVLTYASGFFFLLKRKIFQIEKQTNPRWLW